MRGAPIRPLTPLLGEESFFSLLKRERVHRRRYWGRDEATEDIAEYIDFYNRKRRHSHVGDMSPVQFEKCRN